MFFIPDIILLWWEQLICPITNGDIFIRWCIYFSVPEFNYRSCTGQGSDQSNPSLLSYVDFQDFSQRLIDNAVQHPHTCSWVTHMHDGHCGIPIFAHKFPAHLREYHGISGKGRTPIYCQWVGCGALMNKESINQHVTEMHFIRDIPAISQGLLKPGLTV